MWPYTINEVERLETPRGELAARALAMPADANPDGDIFGGWLMSLMDTAAAVTAKRVAQSRVATVGVKEIEFHQPVKVGDTVCCYAEVGRVGRSSIALHLEVWVLRDGQGPRVKATSGEFAFVALDADGRPQPIRGDRSLAGISARA